MLTNSGFIFSQVKQEWVARFSQVSNSNDGATDITSDKDDNIYVTGASLSQGTQSDYTTIKYNSSGIQQWVRTYNGTGNGPDIANSIIIDNDENVIITGSSVGIGTGVDYITIKYNSTGVQQWIARYTTSGNQRDAAYSLAVDSSDNIYVTGESSNDIGGIDYCTLKYDSLGNQLWAAKYNQGENSSNQAFEIACDDNENVFVTGRSDGDIVTIKYNSLGDQLWLNRFNGPLNDEDFPFSMKLDNFANIYICGTTEGNLHYDDYLILKYSSSGIEQWSRIYNGSANYLDQARDIIIAMSGNLYVTGYATQSSQGYDFTTIKYNTNGDQLWLVNYHNGLNDYSDAIAIDNDENIYVIGESDGNGTGFDYATVKYDSSGKQLWVSRYDYSGQYGDYPTSIVVDFNKCVYVTGSSNRDMLTIKYSQTITGITTNLLELSSNYMLSQNYPNPFNPVTNLEFGISNLGFVSLKVFDVLGNEVETLINEKKNAGSYELKFDGSDYPSGVYFYRLTVDGNIIDTKRMVLLK